MRIFTKDGSVKKVDDNHPQIVDLVEMGWVEEGGKQQLVKEAEALGLTVHHRSGVEKIKKMIEEAKDGDST